MLVFTKKYKPLTVKLMFRLLILSTIMVLVVPYFIEALNYRFAILSPSIILYVSAMVVALGALSYVVAIVGIIWSIIGAEQ